MKAEERHRLHDNDLQRLAEKARLRSQPFFERYGTTILFGIAALIIVIAVAVWWFKSQDTSDAAVWGALNAVLRSPDATAEDFANIADSDQYAGTTAAKWARLLEAEARLDVGLGLMFTDREGALRELQAAREGFEALLDGPAVSPDHAMRVRFGLAKVLEITSDGDLQPAIDQYKEVAELYPETVYETIATARVEALSAPEAKEFYAWFSKQNPTPADPLQRPDDAGAASNPFSGMFPGISDAPASPAEETSETEEPAASEVDAAGEQAAPAEAEANPTEDSATTAPENAAGESEAEASQPEPAQ